MEFVLFYISMGLLFYAGIKKIKQNNRPAQLIPRKNMRVTPPAQVINRNHQYSASVAEKVYKVLQTDIQDLKNKKVVQSPQPRHMNEKPVNISTGFTFWPHQKNENASRHGHRCFISGDATAFEKEIISLLTKNLNHKDYFIFNNIIIPSENSITTEIDHVVVSKYGIFVIESKDFTGWVFASKDRNNWTQTHFQKKYQFRNPILQNHAHIFALREQMPFIKKGKSFHNVVVFSETAEFKRDRPAFYPKELIDYILKQDKPTLERGELLMAIGKLSVLCQTTDVSREQHNKNIGAYLNNFV